MPIRDLKDQIARLPQQPGVYLYFNQAGETIYVGKARTLRDRVRSYLGAYGLHPKTDALLDEADRGPLLLELDGRRYRLTRDQPEDIWAEYDPEEARRVIDEMAGSLPEEEADRMLAELYRRREEASGPLDQA